MTIEMEKSNWPLVILTILAGVVAAAHVGKAPPSLPLLRAELDLSIVHAGWVVSVIAAIAMASGVFAGMLAGIGFGNAGCHMPHAMSYAVAGLVRDYVPAGWETDEPMVPHGISVIVNAPAVFRFTGPHCADRHLKAAELMGADVRNVPGERAGDVLATQVIDMMRRTGMPNGLSGVGYVKSDLDNLTDKAFPQKRLLDNAPCAVSRDDLKGIFADALSYW